MGPIYKYGLENNKQSKKSPFPFAFRLGGDGENGIDKNGDDPDTNLATNIISSAGEDAKKVKSVREGKLERKQEVNKAKDLVKKQKKKALTNADANDAALGLDAGSSKKRIRAEKRRRMQDIQDKERGARREDRRNRGIERLANRNSMTPEDAAKAYDARRETLSAYNVNSNNTTDAKTLNDNENKKSYAENLIAQQDPTTGASGGKAIKTDSATEVKTGQHQPG